MNVCQRTAKLAWIRIGAPALADSLVKGGDSCAIRRAASSAKRSHNNANRNRQRRARQVEARRVRGHARRRRMQIASTVTA